MNENVCSAQWVLGICTGTLLTTLSADSGSSTTTSSARGRIWIFGDIGVQGARMPSRASPRHHVPDGGSTLALLGLDLMGPASGPGAGSRDG